MGVLLVKPGMFIPGLIAGTYTVVVKDANGLRLLDRKCLPG
jgi:hypothetical protein